MEKHAGSQAALIDGEFRNLRRTFTPYIGQTCILSAVTLFSVFIAYKSGDWGFLWVAAIWPLYGIIVLIGLKYRVLYDETSVVMQASGGQDQRIHFDEITEIRYEIGASQSRPFRRLVIIPRHAPDSFIDVSLRHFRLDGIHQLLSVIQEHRPELSLPNIPVK
jgi:hypothetical protein